MGLIGRPIPEVTAATISRRDAVIGHLRGMLATLPLLASFAVPGSAEPADAARDAIRAALTKWTADFNAGRAQEICALFSPDLVYEYRGHPERRHHDICNLLHRSLADPTKRYAYSLVIKEILVSGELAVVRLVWTLKTTGPDATGDVVTQEPAMDVFRRQPDGGWKIIRYIAYEEAG